MGDRHHYVPQFYMKRFSIPGKEDVVYTYRRGGEPFKAKVRDVAVSRNFYMVTLEENGERSDQIERMFSKIEGAAAPVFEKFATSSHIAMSDDAFNLIALFTALLYNRGPVFREKNYNVQKEWGKGLIKFAAENKERFLCMTGRVGFTFKDDDEAEQMRQSWLNQEDDVSIEVTGGEGSLIASMLELSGILTPILLDKRWRILESDRSDVVFVTSDSPVTLIADEWVPADRGKGFANSSVVLPITPTRSLIISNEKPRPSIEIVKVNRQAILFINRNTMAHAFDKIFSNVKSSGIKKAFDKTGAYQNDQTFDIGFYERNS
jgi:hypothetical protein